MNLAEIREAIRVKTGYPERGDTGTLRLNNVINQALRKLWGEVPEVLIREESRFVLEPERAFTVNRNSTDPRVLDVTSTTEPWSVDDENDKILRGRWIEVKGSDDRWHQRRIQDVYRVVQATTTLYVVLDSPFESTYAATNMSAKIYTYEYPYSADTQAIRQVIRNPESSPREVLVSRFGAEISRYRTLNGWQDSGQINAFQRGDYFQLPAPHYTPEASLEPKLVGFGWGFHTNGTTEEADYGAAGTFSYRVCHVWGRWPRENGRISVQADTSKIEGHPFYISAPSKPSEKVSSEWGGNKIRVQCPDLDYINGYGHDSSGTYPSYHRHGVEKWIFRARHEVDLTTPAGMAGTNHKTINADNQYYLWRIVEGHETTVFDRGHFDPVNRKFPLEEYVGHHHIRFDKRPTSKENILLSSVRRPDILKDDNDAPRVPPECYNALIELCCSYLLGDRDGNLKRKSLYYDAYILELEKLKRVYTFSGHERPEFGDGLSRGRRYGASDYPIEEA